MTREDILNTALRQSAVDLGCAPEDLLGDRPLVVRSRPHPGARKYLDLPFLLNLVSYGSCVVAAAGEGYEDLAERYIATREAHRCFETPSLHLLRESLPPGVDVCFMAECWLPDPDRLKALPCPYETRVLTQEDFAELYRPEWSNALCEKRKALDVLGVGAYHEGKLVGLAGCSADCDTMRQIGIDVLPEYRRKGIASALTSRLALEIMQRGKVPFYCCAWSNVPSARNAFRSGFTPAWVELTVRSRAFIDEMNR